MARLIRRAALELAARSASRLARSSGARGVQLVAAAAATTALAACGASGPTDRDQIGALVRDEGARPATVCHHLTSALLARFGGLNNCLNTAATLARDPGARASAITVRGNTATAVVTDSTGMRQLTLVKQRGTWLISGVR